MSPRDLHETPAQHALGKELAGLRAAAPEGLADAVMARVSRERHVLGLGPREWAYVGASFGVWSLALYGIVQWAVRQVAI